MRLDVALSSAISLALSLDLVFVSSYVFDGVLVLIVAVVVTVSLAFVCVFVFALDCVVYFIYGLVAHMPFQCNRDAIHATPHWRK